MADKVYKFLKAAYQAALVGLTSYEVGKNSNSDRQVVIASPKVEHTANETVESTNLIYILIGLAVLAVIGLLLKELNKCFHLSRSVQRPIELVNFPVTQPTKSTNLCQRINKLSEHKTNKTKSQTCNLK